MNGDHRTAVPDALEMLLTYAGAVDVGDVDQHLGGYPVAVATDIYVLPFWTRPFCAAMIRAAELIGFEPDPNDPVPGHEVSLAAISPALFGAVQDDVGRRIWPQLQTVWPLIEYRGLRDAFVIRYVPEQQESLRLHQDIAQVSATVKLNDDHDGGALTFPRQGYDNAEQPVGSLLAWPSLVTHPHEAAAVTGGVMYGLTIWCELPYEY